MNNNYQVAWPDVAVNLFYQHLSHHKATRAHYIQYNAPLAREASTTTWCTQKNPLHVLL